MTSTTVLDADLLKSRVRQHWQTETCGTRYGHALDRNRYFDELANARYRLEPDLKAFANFPAASGKRILEIGVGAGADFFNWCKYADHATGVDLTERAVDLTTERLQLNNVPRHRYHVCTADAENLPLDDDRFDLVYSWGVLHHTPNTERAFAQAWRVLKPGGVLKAMVYHLPSWVGLMLKLNYGIARGNLTLTARQAVFDYLESPGTKSYTVPEGRDFLQRIGFEQIQVWSRLSAGDLLLIKPSKRHEGLKARIIWSLYPRWLVRLSGHRFGLNLLITATKPLK